MSWLTRRLAQVVIAAALALARPATAQEPDVSKPSRPDEALFGALLADPWEPAFFATYLWGRSPRLSSRLGAVGLGETITLIRGANWEWAIAAGVFSQFSMDSPTNDLINADYRIGLPLMYRYGHFAGRFQLYHQSSHLGDEYLLHTRTARADLTFESAELVVAHSRPPWRLYGGGEYAFIRSPADLEPGVLRAGAEYRATVPFVHFGRFATWRLVSALDVASFQARAWQAAWSGVAGVEMTTPRSTWSWSLLLKAYTGPAPYGQFYRDPLSSIGAGIAFSR